MVIDTEVERLAVPGAEEVGGRARAAVAAEQPGRRVEEIGGELGGGDASIRQLVRADTAVGNGVGLEGIGDGSERLARRQGSRRADLDLQPETAAERACRETGEQRGEGPVADGDGGDGLVPLLGAAGGSVPEGEAEGVGS